jgi:hypothetical protein
MSPRSSRWIHKWRFVTLSGSLPSSPLTAPQAAYFYGCLELDALFSEFPDRMREVCPFFSLPNTSSPPQTLNELAVDPEEILTLGGCGGSEKGTRLH